jgi:hypothetical protein
VIAETLVAQTENVQKAVTVLCEAAGRGDLAAAKALVPYLDQALGKPTVDRASLRGSRGRTDSSGQGGIIGMTQPSEQDCVYGHV